MDEWLNSPVVVVAVLSAIGVLIGIGRWVGKVDSDRSKFGKFMEEIRKDIKEILLRIPPAVVTRSSSLRLTTLGERVSDKIQAKRLAEQLAPELRARIAGRLPYEIQETCQHFVHEEFKPTAEQLAQFKNCAYEEGLKVDVVYDVIVVELRDQLLPPACNQQPQSDY